MKTKEYTYENHPLFILPNLLAVVRHGESEINVLDDDGVADSSTPSHNFSLTKSGRNQAKAVGKTLKHFFNREFPSVICQSTYRRARETCEIALREYGVKGIVITDSRLNEKDEGIRHKLKGKDIESFFPLAKYLFGKYGKYHHIPIHGESVPQVEMRIRDLMRDIVQNNKRNALFFGHGVWMKILHHMVSMSTTGIYDESGGIPHPKNGSIYIYKRFDRKTTLEIHDIS